MLQNVELFIRSRSNIPEPADVWFFIQTQSVNCDFGLRLIISLHPKRVLQGSCRCRRGEIFWVFSPRQIGTPGGDFLRKNWQKTALGGNSPAKSIPLGVEKFRYFQVWGENPSKNGSFSGVQEEKMAKNRCFLPQSHPKSLIKAQKSHFSRLRRLYIHLYRYSI